jgi:hypothetical protein
VGDWEEDTDVDGRADKRLMGGLMEGDVYICEEEGVTG